MASEVEMHVVVVVPLTLDKFGNVLHVGQPTTCDENPFEGDGEETYVIATNEWRQSTDEEITTAYDRVSALLFKREGS